MKGKRTAMSLTTADEREWDDQRAIFRQRGARKSGEDGTADQAGQRDLTPAGYYANSVIERWRGRCG
jgi:hypothetical protein